MVWGKSFHYCIHALLLGGRSFLKGFYQTYTVSVLPSLSMDFDFIEKLQSINLTEEEGEVIKVQSDNRAKIMEECSLSFMGHFHTAKLLNIWVAKNLLQSMWKHDQDLKIMDVGEGLLQFKFSIENQLNWVLNNGPWSFDNHLLLLRRWEKGMIAFKVDFKFVPIWVQVWGLPFDLINEDARKDIGGSSGRVLDMDCKAIVADQARFLRI